MGFTNKSHAEVRAPFEGEWEYHDDGLDFGIHLHQKENHLFGWHSGSTKNGNRTDTAVDGEGDPSIEGLIEGRTALVTVRSAYSDALSKVKLTLQMVNVTYRRTRLLIASIDVKRESCLSRKNLLPNQRLHPTRPANAALAGEPYMLANEGAKFYESLRHGIFDSFIVRGGRASGIR